MKERIQKLLAHAGYGSRREIERWITAGDIRVNGQLATLGQQISETDRISLRGRPLNLSSRLKATPKVIMYHKKAGEVCTRNDPDGRPTVFDKLPRIRQGRWVMIGRLDVNTDGLLLFTTDGELANKMMHPSSEIEREYACRILGNVDNEMLQRLKKGVELEDGPAHFMRISDAGGEGANHWYHVVLAEGRNREVRRLWESQGLKVSRLIRVRYGDINLPRYLRGGHNEELDVKAMRQLYTSVGMIFDDGSLTGPGANSNTSRPGNNKGNRTATNKPRPQATEKTRERSDEPKKANPYANARKKLDKRPKPSRPDKRR